MNKPLPMSAKKVPVFVFLKIDNYELIKEDLCYLTKDEQYFVSFDYERVYPVNDERVLSWSIATPMTQFKEITNVL